MNAIRAKRWGPRRALALLGLLFCAPAMGQDGSGSVVERLARSVEELAARAQRAMDSFETEARSRPVSQGVCVLTACTAGPVWTPLGAAARTPERVIVLIHGLDEPGGIFDDLAPELHKACPADTGLARFDYLNDGPIAASADTLLVSLRDLRARGTSRVDIVAHSMGGLVARDALTRDTGYGGTGLGHADLPDLQRLILVGTPNAGSPWAKLRALGEIREHIARFLDDPDHDARGLLGYLNDGLGEAGDDLLPGSPFLTDLNSRPFPTGVMITVIAGRVAPVCSEDLQWIAQSWLVRQIVGREEAEAIAEGIEDLASELGDGVVPVSSAAWEGVTDTVYLEANHRAMLRTIDVVQSARGLLGAPPGLPPAVPIIVDRLGR